MSSPSLSDERFRTELEALLAKAHEADVSLNGVWTCDIPDDDHHCWNVEITLAMDTQD